MPELPEIETVVDGLAPKVEDKIIEDVEVVEDTIIENEVEKPLEKSLQSLEINKVRRRGKYIIFEFDNQLKLGVHLRMTGRILYSENEDETGQYDYNILRLESGQIRLGTQRKFTSAYWVEDLS